MTAIHSTSRGGRTRWWSFTLSQNLHGRIAHQQLRHAATNVARVPFVCSTCPGHAWSEALRTSRHSKSNPHSVQRPQSGQASAQRAVWPDWS